MCHRASILFALVLMTGCTAGPADMRGFDDCKELDRYMKGAPLRELLGNAAAGAASIDYDNVLVTGFDDGSGGDVGTPDVPAGAANWTDTNLQHAGVDEADLVKTDGTNVFAISGGKLVISQAWPVQDAAQLATLAVDGSAVGLYHYDTTVVVVSTLGGDPDPRSDIDARDEKAGWHDSPSVAATVVDVTVPAEPIVIRETYTTGVLRESRRIDDQLIVVTTEDSNPDDVSEPTSKEIASYREEVGLDWLPVRFDNVLAADSRDWEVTSEPACDCKRVVAPTGGTEAIMTAVVALDLSDPLSEFDGGAIVGPADIVYSSPERLYIANAEEDEEAEQFDMVGGPQTAIHRFSLTGKLPKHEASTAVVGLLPDRFGLSEFDGTLRVATLDTVTVTSGVTTLDVADPKGFDELDHLGGLAPGEDLTAARFVDEFGYLVTYVEEKGDPLFTFDLTDPENIIQGGELDLPGWSDYLHPMAEPGKLLAVGMDQTWTGAWVLSLSIFDVSDPASPQLNDRVKLDATGSEASTDHHAFTYDPATGYVTIPSWSSHGDTVLEVVHATAAKGLKPIGQLTQPTFGDAACTPIRRSIHMDGMVWSYSAGGLTAASLEEPERVEATVPFDGVDPCKG